MRTIVFAHLCQIGPGLAASDQGGMARGRMAWKNGLRERETSSFSSVAGATQIGVRKGILASSAEKLGL